MWIFYALVASLCWGMSYAASGPILTKGFSPLLFFFGYALFALLGATTALMTSGKISSIWKLPFLERADAGWFILSLTSAGVGAYLTYVAMGAKNPTLAALIEISYPLFVVLFTWLFFREMQLNAMTLCGGILLLAGVTVIVLGER